MIYTIDIYRKGTGEKVRGIEAEAGDILSLTGVSGAADAEVVVSSLCFIRFRYGLLTTGTRRTHQPRSSGRAVSTASKLVTGLRFWRVRKVSKRR